jgi:hypothetical protein
VFNLKAAKALGLALDPERKSRRRFCYDAQRVAATLTPQFVYFPPLEKYLGEVRLQRFEIGRLTAEADIAVGTDHIQTCTSSSIAVV